MPRNKDIKKVLVIGSGPIVIGQAAEFDYAGTQACRSLKEEGLEVVLLNSNPATIMTDKDIADRVYIEPLTVEVVEQLILKEKPDSVLPTLGGQAGLNLAMELEEAGFLKEHNVRLIGKTYKLKYGHRGGNHPVKDLQTGRVYISSQNHGYAVDADSIPESVAVPAFVNVNDNTNEGMSYVGKNIFTVQFHPEACPGPQDSGYLFDRFMDMMGGTK